MKKEFQDILSHDDGYIIRFVEIPTSKEYFIEAISRLDGMIDKKIIEIASVSLNDSNRIIFRLKDENAINPTRLAIFLKKEGILDNSIQNKIEKFKECRNKVVHIMHGEHDVALKESKFFEKEGICYNCIGCLNEHLNNLGSKNLEDYTKKVLKNKIKEGLDIYKQLRDIWIKAVEKVN